MPIGHQRPGSSRRHRARSGQTLHHRGLSRCLQHELRVDGQAGVTEEREVHGALEYLDPGPDPLVRHHQPFVIGGVLWRSRFYQPEPRHPVMAVRILIEPGLADPDLSTGRKLEHLREIDPARVPRRDRHLTDAAAPTRNHRIEQHVACPRATARNDLGLELIERQALGTEGAQQTPRTDLSLRSRRTTGRSRIALRTGRTLRAWWATRRARIALGSRRTR